MPMSVLASTISSLSTSVLKNGHSAYIARSTCEIPAHIKDEIRNMCRAESRPILEGLAQRVVTNARWEDLVLPENNIETLRAMVAQARKADAMMKRTDFTTPCALS